MGKITGIVLAVAALAVAIYLRLRRRSPASLAPTSRLGVRFALLVTLISLALPGGPARPARVAAAEKAGPAADAVERVDAVALKKSTAWKQIQSDWLAVEKLSGFGWDEMNKRVDEARKVCAARLLPLAKQGALSTEAASVFCQAYGDRVYHKLRLTAATCYDPTMLGAKVQATRSDLEKRLTALSKLVKSGQIKPAAVEKSRQAILRQLELLAQASAHWADQPKDDNWEKYRARSQAIMALYTKDDYKTITVKEGIPLRPGLAGAGKLIQLIYEN